MVLHKCRTILYKYIDIHRRSPSLWSDLAEKHHLHLQRNQDTEMKHLGNRPPEPAPDTQVTTVLPKYTVIACQHLNSDFLLG